MYVRLPNLQGILAKDTFRKRNLNLIFAEQAQRAISAYSHLVLKRRHGRTYGRTDRRTLLLRCLYAPKNWGLMMLIVSPFLFLWTNPLWFQWQIYAVVIHAKMGQTVKWTTMNTIATAVMVLRGATVRLQVKLKVLNNSCTWFYVKMGMKSFRI